MAAVIVLTAVIVFATRAVLAAVAAVIVFAARAVVAAVAVAAQSRRQRGQERKGGINPECCQIHAELLMNDGARPAIQPQ